MRLTTNIAGDCFGPDSPSRRKVLSMEELTENIMITILMVKKY